jgi:hypothetical protein
MRPLNFYTYWGFSLSKKIERKVLIHYRAMSLNEKINVLMAHLAVFTPHCILRLNYPYCTSGKYAC